MIDMYQKIRLIVAQITIDAQGWESQTETEIELRGSVSTGSFHVSTDDNGNALMASRKIIIKNFDLEKVGMPAYVVLDGQKLKIIGIAKFPNHVELYA